MRRAARGLILGGAICAALPGFAPSSAQADRVWPFKGNDTGGIIAWDYATHTDAQKLAIDHCAQYGKVVKPLAAQHYYGGYISFACVWRPTPVVPGAIAVKG
jgi:hypothetical protein